MENRNNIMKLNVRKNNNNNNTGIFSNQRPIAYLNIFHVLLLGTYDASWPYDT